MNAFYLKLVKISVVFLAWILTRSRKSATFDDVAELGVRHMTGDAMIPAIFTYSAILIAGIAEAVTVLDRYSI